MTEKKNPGSRAGVNRGEPIVRRPRDSFAMVGRATRFLIQRALEEKRPPLSAGTLRVLLAIVHRLSSYSRLGDHLAVGHIANVAHVDRRTARRALKELSELGLLDYTPGSSEKGQPRRMSYVRLFLHPDDCKKKTGDTPDPGLDVSEPFDGSRPGTESNGDRGQNDAATGVIYLTPYREELTEKTNNRAVSNETGAPEDRRAEIFLADFFHRKYSEER